MHAQQCVAADARRLAPLNAVVRRHQTSMPSTTPRLINGARSFAAGAVVLGAIYCTVSLLGVRVVYPWAPWISAGIGTAGLIGIELMSSALSSALRRVAGFLLLGAGTGGFAFAVGIAKYAQSWPGLLIAAGIYFGYVFCLSRLFNLRLDHRDRRLNGDHVV